MGRLHDRMAEDLTLRNFSPATRRNYLLYARKFAAFFMRSPEDMGEPEIRQFLLHQLEVKHLTHASYRQIYAALKFLYTVTLGRAWEVEHLPYPRQRLRSLPVVLHAEELAILFQTIRSMKYRALFMTCYAAGLRINEACHLRVEDIDSKQMLVHVRHAKGGKERITLLSAKLLEVLRSYWMEQKPRHWLFPGKTPDRPLSSDTARQALEQICLDAGLTKKCTPHTFRMASAYYTTSKRMAYFQGNSPWSGDVFCGWRPCRTANTAACTLASCRSCRAMIHGARATVCCAGSTRCLISRLITVSLTSRECAACSTVSQSTPFA